jgi:hypothetical protein
LTLGSGIWHSLAGTILTGGEKTASLDFRISSQPSRTGWQNAKNQGLCKAHFGGVSEHSMNTGILNAHPNYPRYAERFLENSYKFDLLFYFGLAASVDVDCFDFVTILNEMVAERQDILRDLAEDGNFADILMSLGKLEGAELRQALRRVSDLITN